MDAVPEGELNVDTGLTLYNGWPNLAVLAAWTAVKPELLLLVLPPRPAPLMVLDEPNEDAVPPEVVLPALLLVGLVLPPRPCDNGLS
jgi:hypothetical protein